MQHKSYGYLAMEFGGDKLPIEVLKSAAGYYIGTRMDGGPYSRESVEYWGDEGGARSALESGNWTQRDHP